MDTKWAEHLVDCYADTLIRIGYTWFKNLFDAQDICQMALIKALEGRKDFSSPEAERAWVIRIAINECKNMKKSAWYRKTVGLDEGMHLSIEPPEDSGVLAVVQKLPLKYRQVIYLRYFEGYEVHEIADLLGLSPALVSTHLARAKAKLKKTIGGEPNVRTI